ncbi:hypothetical protein LTS10_013312 [Elasticomyces elasticus]|nr:hypothetical protein LTS10_013312 [Elasticomyces elasticus]
MADQSSEPDAYEWLRCSTDVGNHTPSVYELLLSGSDRHERLQDTNISVPTTPMAADMADPKPDTADSFHWLRDSTDASNATPSFHQSSQDRDMSSLKRINEPDIYNTSETQQRLRNDKDDWDLLTRMQPRIAALGASLHTNPTEDLAWSLFIQLIEGQSKKKTLEGGSTIAVLRDFTAATLRALNLCYERQMLFSCSDPAPSNDGLTIGNTLQLGACSELTIGDLLRQDAWKGGQEEQVTLGPVEM